MVREVEEEKEGKGMRLGKHELGRIRGEQNFAKFKFAKNIENGKPVAVRILEKKILNPKIIYQIKREIATLKLLRHPNIADYTRQLIIRARSLRDGV